MIGYIVLGILITATLFVVAMSSRAGEADKLMGYK